MCPLYHMEGNVIDRFKSLTTYWCVIRREMVNILLYIRVNYTYCLLIQFTDLKAINFYLI